MPANPQRTDARRMRALGRTACADPSKCDGPVTAVAWAIQSRVGEVAMLFGTGWALGRICNLHTTPHLPGRRLLRRLHFVFNTAFQLSRRTESTARDRLRQVHSLLFALLLLAVLVRSIGPARDCIHRRCLS